MIIYRKRYWTNKFWLEYLFVPSTDHFELPKTLPPRYTNRIVKQNDHSIEVKSLYSDNFQSIHKHYLLHCLGIWLVANDCQNQHFMNIPIHNCDEIIDFDKINFKSLHPLSLYHGTSKELLQECTKTLNPSHGMLGFGIYLGTFWKACRFAVRDQSYHIRNGSILRYLVFPSNIIEFPRLNWTCLCQKCLDNDWAANISDHDTKWSLIGDAAHASPCQGIGVRNDGQQKWALKNEEYCVNCPILLTHTANINLDTVEPHYDPYQRNIFIN
jgi:hypothetical protein